MSRAEPSWKSFSFSYGSSQLSSDSSLFIKWIIHCYGIRSLLGKDSSYQIKKKNPLDIVKWKIKKHIHQFIFYKEILIAVLSGNLFTILHNWDHRWAVASWMLGAANSSKKITAHYFFWVSFVLTTLVYRGLWI